MIEKTPLNVSDKVSGSMQHFSVMDVLRYHLFSIERDYPYAKSDTACLL